MEHATLTFLGCGGSSGVPIIGCTCSVCRSHNPFNHRLRSSALIEDRGKVYLIDASPDLREQFLRAKLNHLDGLFLTHTHYDHIGGLEELRTVSYLQQKAIPCFLSESSLDNLKKVYYYHFQTSDKEQNYKAEIDFQVLPHENNMALVDGKEFFYFPYRQGGMEVLGFRFKNLAYVTDIKEFDDSIFSYLEDLDILILSSPRAQPTRVQFSLDEALSFLERVNPKKTYLMHLSHEIDYEKCKKKLPAKVYLAYDGLKLPFVFS
jgi:phosphoribosyl 1,2-cyclic phosphate phosphodiesterase